MWQPQSGSSKKSRRNSNQQPNMESFNDDYGACGYTSQSSQPSTSYEYQTYGEVAPGQPFCGIPENFGLPSSSGSQMNMYSDGSSQPFDEDMSSFSSLGPLKNWRSQEILEWAKKVAHQNQIPLDIDRTPLASIAEHISFQNIASFKPCDFCDILGERYGSVFYEAFQELQRSNNEDESYSPLQRVPGRAGSERGPTIWEFIVNLLTSPETCPSHIKWVNPSEYTFRIVKKNEIAHMWGNRNDPRDNALAYDNFAKGMRYHYKTGGLFAVPNKQLVYRLGPKAIQYLCSKLDSSHQFP